MLKNLREYRVTTAAVARLEEAISELDHLLAQDPSDAETMRFERTALRSQLDTLMTEIDDYEQLVRGNVEVLDGAPLADLPQVLIRARTIRGMSQRELAERIGVSPQQIQRYEANDFRGVAFDRLLEVAEALDLNITNRVAGDGSPGPASPVYRNLRSVGLSQSLIEDRLVPAADPSLSSAEGLAKVAERIYGPIHPNGPRTLDVEPLLAASFKLPKRYSDPPLLSYTLYAHYVARLVVQATPSAPAGGIRPGDADEFRAFVLDRFGDLSLMSCVRTLFELGVVVLPLSDRGTFHGAFWRVDGRDVVILKQAVRSCDRWTFDLLHEYWHALAADGARALTRLVIDGDVGASDDEEEAANVFAGDVVLGGGADVLARDAVARAGGRVERLKAVATDVARDHRVSVGAFANYLAWRLQHQGINWWGTANNLQDTSVDPWRVCRDLLLEVIDLGRLDPDEQRILASALSERED